MAKIRLCLFSSTPDFLNWKFMVRVLTGTPEELAECAVAWGYDGIEFLPDPERVPDPHRLAAALRNAGAVLPVVNTGRMAAQGLTLLPLASGPRQGPAGLGPPLPPAAPGRLPGDWLGRRGSRGRS